MRKVLCLRTLAVFVCVTALVVPAAAQSTGSTSRTVTDVQHGALPGAQIVASPGNLSVASDERGKFHDYWRRVWDIHTHVFLCRILGHREGGDGRRGPGIER